MTAATAAVAVFAGVQLYRESQREKERRLSAHARIAALAFLLRRQQRSWLGPGGGGSVDAFEEWIRAAQNAHNLGTHVDRAEGRFVELLTIAADAGAEIMNAVRSAAVHYFAGAERLNTYVATDRPDGIDIADWVQLRNDAWKDFRDCVRILDTKVGAGVLLQEARLLNAKRAKENPSMDILIARLAHELARLDEEEENTGAARTQL